jgi:2,3-dihydroxybiphenyl 1,2-dioxygenase
MELAYVGVEVGDRDGVNRVFRDVVGLLPGPVTPEGWTTWRDDDKVHRVFVAEGPANDATFVGFELDADSFDGAVARLAGQGLEVTAGTAAELKSRQVDRLARVEAPWGAKIELVTGLAVAAHPFDSELVPGGFHTKGVGFGHVVFQVGDENELDAVDRFAREGLGLTQSDWFDGYMGPVPVFVRFYHCNARHHTLAVGYSPAGKPPGALNHIMFETVSEENVGHGLDRAHAAGVPIDSALGRHDNDRMFSFYMMTPGGFRVEFGYGAREITEPWQDNRRYDRPSIWGHAPESPAPAV